MLAQGSTGGGVKEVEVCTAQVGVRRTGTIERRREEGWQPIRASIVFRILWCEGRAGRVGSDGGRSCHDVDGRLDVGRNTRGGGKLWNSRKVGVVRQVGGILETLLNAAGLPYSLCSNIGM